MAQPARIDAIGISWYRGEDYDRILAIMEDGEKLPLSYGEWLVSAEGVERTLRQKGLRVLRAHIYPDEFIVWCTERGVSPNAEARTTYSSDFARQITGRD
jgi:hypothetical protein